MQVAVAVVKSQLRKTILERCSHHRAPLNNKAARLRLCCVKKALDGKSIRLRGVFFEQGDSKDYSFAFCVNAAKDNNVSSEASSLQSFVQEDEVLIPLVLSLHLR